MAETVRKEVLSILRRLFTLGLYILIGVFSAAPAMAKSTRFTCIFYDSSAENPSYRLGEVYAIMTQNLLGHFREITPKVAAVLAYEKGGVKDCHDIIYLGSYYGTKIPLAFLEDVAATTKPVLWMNYNIWQLQAQMGTKAFVEKFGFTYETMIGYRQPPVDDSRPSFFQRFFYKQVEFTKYYRWDAMKERPVGSPEIVGVKLQGAKTIAVAQRNDSEERTPYITQKGSQYFVGDIPFSFIHESDRYLIITDLMFDFLKLPPRHKKKYAVIRIEDIHPMFYRDPLMQTISLLESLQVPYLMSIIPRYIDDLGAMNGKLFDQSMSATPDFVKILKRASQKGAGFVLHGYTHQVTGTSGCSGVSGSDFEFWDGCRNAPIPYANEKWVRERLKAAKEEFQKVGLNFVAWTTPHYEASQVSYRVFADVFPRTLQRARYMPWDVDSSKDKITWTGQFFPYIIFKDFYGQFTWPENLGNLVILDARFKTPEDRLKYGFNQRTVADMKRSLTQLRVIRDAWASFYWHPQHISSIAGLSSLSEIIALIRSEGYEFLDLRHPPKDIL